MASDRSFARLRGFRDFPPEGFALRRHIFSAWRRVARGYGFREYDGPVLEPLPLYVVKSGEEIVEQLYSFADKGGREVALRPEMTPSLARILAGRSRRMPKPIRWFSIPQLFRYERSQRGRLREHFQLNVDVVGEAGVAADAEVLAVAIDAVRALGLAADDFEARISDRRLFGSVLEHLKIHSGAHEACLAAIDKAGRSTREQTIGRLLGAGLPSSAAGTLADLAAHGTLDDVRSATGDAPGVLAAMEPVQEALAILGAMGLGDFVRFDFSIVRGLAYYTGIVFELFDRAGELRAICGGGRYDRLLELVGGEPLPAVGFGMGDVVLGELLRDRDLVPRAVSSCDDFLVWVTPDQRAAAMGAAHRLRDAGRSTMYALRAQNVGRQLRQAARSGASRAVIFGPDEAAQGLVTVRHLQTGRQETIPLDALFGGSRAEGSQTENARQ